MHPYIHCSIIYNSQDIKTTYVSANEWIKKDVVNLHNGMLFSHKKNEILPSTTTWMDLEVMMLSKTSQMEKEKCHMTSLICGN